MSILFPIQKGSKIILAWTMLVFITCVFALSMWRLGCNNNSFLKYSDKDYYTPIGFTKKVNAMLESALKDHQNINYTVDSINFFYNRLKFSCSYDSSNIVGTLQISLDTFICADSSEVQFYYNSYLKDVIEDQREHPDRQYFYVKYKPQYPYEIVSITINPSLYKLKLGNESWNGNVNYNEPFKQIEDNIIFLVFSKNFLPLFPSDDYNPGDARFDISYHNDIFSDNQEHNDTLTIKHDLIKFYQKRDTALRVYFDSRALASSPNITFKNQTHSCALQFNNIDSGYIHYKDGSFQPIINNIRNDTVEIQNVNLPVKIEFKHGNNRINFIITDKSPMSIASAPANSFQPQKRLHPNDDYTDWFCKQFINTLDNGLPANTLPKEINLSLNPLLSKYLQDEMKEHIRDIKAIPSVRNYSNPEDIFQMSVCLIDNRTGEIMTAPNYSTQFDASTVDNILNTKNFNLTKHFIGSTFKPLLANAASIKFPNLRNFRLSVNDENTFLHSTNNECRILGYPIRPFSSGLGYNKTTGTENSFWGDYRNMSRIEFLRHSHDLYPIELGMLALTEEGDPSYRYIVSENANLEALKNLFVLNTLNNHHHNNKLNVQDNRTTIDDMKNSSLFILLSRLYNVNLSNTYDKNLLTWEYRYDTALLPKMFKLLHAETILPEATSLNADILGTDITSDEFTHFSTWVLGQGKNEWNNLKLAEAYARLFTKKNVQISYWNGRSENFIFPQITTDSIFNRNYQIYTAQNIVNAEWHNFLTDFRVAQFGSDLLTPATTSLNRAIAQLGNNLGINAGRLTITGKTGTPGNFERGRKYITRNTDNTIVYDEGLYAFSIMDSAHYNANISSGITGVVFIRHISTNKGLLNSGRDNHGISSSHARDFLNPERLLNIILMNKRRLNINQ